MGGALGGRGVCLNVLRVERPKMSLGSIISYFHPTPSHTIHPSHTPPTPHLLPMQALADPECYHEFCRLLMRLKSNYQLVELMRLDDYPQFIELVAKFTVSSLQVWEGEEVV